MDREHYTNREHASRVRDQRRPGHFWADNEVLDNFGPSIGAYGLAVYMVLARRAHNQTGQVRISNRAIARCIGISTHRVRKSLATLHDVGLIIVEMPDNPRSHESARYTLLEVLKTGRHTLTQPGAVQPEVGSTRLDAETLRPQLGGTRPFNKEERLKDSEDSKTKSPSISAEEERAVEMVYEQYPRHIAKRRALKAILSAADRLVQGEAPGFVDRHAALRFLAERASAFARSPAGQRGYKTPYPENWFNDARYLDDPNEWEHLDDRELDYFERARQANIGAR